MEVRITIIIMRGEARRRREEGTKHKNKMEEVNVPFHPLLPFPPSFFFATGLPLSRYPLAVITVLYTSAVAIFILFLRRRMEKRGEEVGVENDSAGWSKK